MDGTYSQQCYALQNEAALQKVRVSRGKLTVLNLSDQKKITSSMLPSYPYFWPLPVVRLYTFSSAEFCPVLPTYLFRQKIYFPQICMWRRCFLLFHIFHLVEMHPFSLRRTTAEINRVEEVSLRLRSKLVPMTVFLPTVRRTAGLHTRTETMIATWLSHKRPHFICEDK